MPVYVFTCHECGSFELARPMTEASSRACCPTCEREARRVFTPPHLARLAAPCGGSWRQRRGAHTSHAWGPKSTGVR